MRDVVARLRDILARQLESQETLLRLSAEKRGVVISCDTARLDEITKLELREMAKMTNAEKKRKALLPELSNELGVPQNASLREIIDGAEPDERVILTRLRIAMTDAYDQLRDINAANKTLLEQQIEYSDAILSLYIPGDEINNLYSDDRHGGAGGTFLEGSL